MSNSDRYERRGVSANKSEVHEAIKNIDKGLYPLAFCKILPDYIAHDNDYCTIMHADTAGTKTSLAYMYWKETGDITVWRGIVQDALVMNLDDMACVGCIDDIIISSTIGRNKSFVTGAVISEVINYAQSFFDQMKQIGINLHSAGGETADVGDIVRTADIGYTTFGRMRREDVIDMNVVPGCYIVGFASYGKSTYETEYNGGMGSNGLTSARHDVFSAVYRDKYPETYNPQTDIDLVYSGSKMLDETIEIEGEEIPIGKLVLSPTRTYLPVIKKLIDEVKSDINGMVHCTGGGQTKVMHFVGDGVKIIKDNLFNPPPLFEMIQKESLADNKEMYQVFNMGHRLEVYTQSLAAANKMIEIGHQFDIDTQIIGRVESTEGKSELTIVTPNGEKIEY